MRHITFLGYANGKNFLIDGINIFNFDWVSTGECVTVIHPDTKKSYTFSVYSCDVGDTIIKFAFGSFSKGIKAFYKISD